MPQSHDDDWTYLRRLLITAVVVALAYVAWRISGILLLLFAAILVARRHPWCGTRVERIAKGRYHEWSAQSRGAPF